MKNNDKYVEAKKYLQKRYPKELSDKRWNTSDINDDWVTEMMTDFASQSKPQEIPEENRQKLFNHMSTEHGLTLLESEMNSIYSICIGHEEYVKYLNWMHSKPVDTKTVDAVDTTFWRRLEMFVSNIQVNDMAGEEEKQYIIHVIESKK